MLWNEDTGRVLKGVDKGRGAHMKARYEKYLGYKFAF